jgi:hypothetical protein
MIHLEHITILRLTRFVKRSLLALALICAVCLAARGQHSAGADKASILLDLRKARADYEVAR